jgi:hypothetical protein
MKIILICMAFLMLFTDMVLAQDFINHSDDQSGSEINQYNRQNGFENSWDNNETYMTPYKNDAYGPDVHSDATGKPFEWETQDGKSSNSKKVKRDGYGLGVGMDEYGRPVKPGALDE